MTDQRPATPGTAARCEVCGLPKDDGTMADGCARDPDPALDSDGTCYRLGYERLKAENASIRANVDQLVGDVQAVAQDYTNAAGALRWIADWDKQPVMMQVARTLHYDMATKARAALSGEEAAGPAEPAKEALSESLPTRASLLESLREAEKEIPETFYAGVPFPDRVEHLARIWRKAVSANQDLETALAAAEQRAEAAEKRVTDLMGVLRSFVAAYNNALQEDGERIGRKGREAGLGYTPVYAAFVAARAALHDEERSAPGGEDGKQGSGRDHGREAFD